jgi:hypothetical protein
LAETDYQFSGDPADAALRLPIRQIEFLDDEERRITSYSSYKLGRPQVIEVVLRHSDESETALSTTRMY